MLGICPLSRHMSPEKITIADIAILPSSTVVDLAVI